MKPNEFRFPVLISYAYLRKLPDAWIETLLKEEAITILLDSGAFTAFNIGEAIDLKEYLAFLKRWQNELFAYIALDKIQDPETTKKNLDVMLDAGFKPVPVHVLGDDEARLDELFTFSDYVALAGFRRPHRGAAPKSYVKEKMKWAKGRKVHWLGYSNESMLQLFRPFSCDVSSWASGKLYGRVDFYFGRGRWKHRSLKESQDRAMIDPDIVRFLHAAGFDEREFLHKDYWHSNLRKGIPAARNITTNVNLLSWLMYTKEFYERFGSRVFLASLPTGADMKLIIHWAKKLRRNQVRLESPVIARELV